MSDAPRASSDQPDTGMSPLFLSITAHQLTQTNQETHNQTPATRPAAPSASASVSGHGSRNNTAPLRRPVQALSRYTNTTALRNAHNRLSQEHERVRREYTLLLAAFNRVRQEFTTEAERYRALQRQHTQLLQNLNRLATESHAIPLPLQHPNNVRRAHESRQQQPRQSRIASLREADGGLDLRRQAALPPPPQQPLPAVPVPAAPAPQPTAAVSPAVPAVPTNQDAVQAREDRPEAAGDNRPLNPNNEQAGEEMPDADAGDRSGPTAMDEE